MAFPTLATHFDHEILGSEYCSGYNDVFGKWNTGFYCPQTGSSLAVYCCGMSTFKYCCTTKPSGTYGTPTRSGEEYDDDITSLYLSDTPVIIAITCGIAAVVILVIVASCFLCSCCVVYKKRSQVPGMYLMQDSSTTSGLASYHQTSNQNHNQHQHQSYSQSNSHNHNPSSTNTGLGGNNGIHPNNTRPIISIPPQQMTCQNNSNIIIGSEGTGTGDGSLASSPLELDWSPQPHQASLFHINNNHSSGISSNHINLLPPPARFASNQNLSGIPVVDRSNPRDAQHHSYGAPYTLTSDRGQGSLQHQNYSTSTLPSCLRRSTAGGGSFSGQSHYQQQNQPQPQQLKSILRNPQNNINPNSSSNNCISTYRRAATDYDFCEALLPQNSSCYQDSPSSYNGRPSNEIYTDYNNRPFTPEPNSHIMHNVASSGIGARRYSSANTEYQNDLNRLGKDLDPESLSRLIELDLDSKL